MKPAIVMLVSSALALPLAACGEKPAPLTASAADHPAYAERYPAKLTALRERFAADEKTTRETMKEFPTYPGEISGTDPAHVARVVDLANEDGKSGDYASSMEEVAHVVDFYVAEKEEIHKKVGGSVTYAAKQKQCDADLYGPAVSALDKAMEKQLEERLREHSAAHRYIEDNEDAIGKNNVEKLQKQADLIAFTSYAANVRLEESRRELEIMIAEGSDVESTLDRTIEESKAAAADQNRSKTAQTRAKERLDAATAAKGRVKQDLEAAKNALSEMEKRVEAVRRDYEKALDGLRDAVEKMPKAAPKA